jgi:hypothetical protein
MQASWNKGRPGRDNTLTVTGTPMPLFSAHVDALWTSAPLTVAKNATIGRLELSCSAVSLNPSPNPAFGAQKVSVRFKSPRAPWSGWVPIYSGALGSGLSDTRTTIPIRYRGASGPGVQFQIMVSDEFTYLTQLKRTVHITA